MRTDSSSNPGLGLLAVTGAGGMGRNCEPIQIWARDMKLPKEKWTSRDHNARWLKLPWAFNMFTHYWRWLQWKRGLFIYCILNMIDCWHSLVLSPTPGNAAFFRWPRLVTGHVSPHSAVSSSVFPLQFPVTVSSVGCWNLSSLVAAPCCTGSF